MGKTFKENLKVLLEYPNMTITDWLNHEQIQIPMRTSFYYKDISKS